MTDKLNTTIDITGPRKSLNFIDLFAGLGGFHLALAGLGHKCVFASELNSELRELYKINHNTDIEGDINLVQIDKIPPHNILCAGFPCQPFSQAGSQMGLADPRNGNLFYKIMEIVNLHTPEYIFLENVANLKSHDNGNTWKEIYNHLQVLYDVREKVISPHHFGIPQHRARLYIVCRLKTSGGLSYFEFPENEIHEDLSILNIVEDNATDYMSLRPNTLNHLDVWQEFLDHLTPEEAPTFPIWAMEFGATYPFEGKAPIKQKADELKKYKGKFGCVIEGHSMDDLLLCLPTYVQDAPKEDKDEYPTWKKLYIRHNRAFYEKHKDWLDDWIPKIQSFETSHQKFEWNCGTNGSLTINDKIVQFRPSGIRVKQPTYSPALVLASTQIPIFPWLNRYMTKKEAARLQCMDDLKELPVTIGRAFRALGNAVNVCVVSKIAKNLIE